MAASATLRKTYRIHGPGGYTVETGNVTYDGDATVELKTKLTQISGAAFVKTGGGAGTTPGISETVTNGVINVSSGAITVVELDDTSNTYLYTLWGF